MIDGDKRLAFIVIGLVCVTILAGLLFAALWRFREIVAWTLLGLLVAFAMVVLGWLINELFLRRARYKYKQETPVMASQYPPSVKTAQTTGPYSMPTPNQYYYPSAAYDGQREEPKY